MENEHIDLIISLVKQNKKFSGLESLLDDIVNDVFEHSKVVLSTVKDHSVIEQYLNKIINTSIISVPKRAGLNTRNSHKEILATINDSIYKNSDDISALEENVFNNTKLDLKEIPEENIENLYEQDLKPEFSYEVVDSQEEEVTFIEAIDEEDNSINTTSTEELEQIETFVDKIDENSDIEIENSEAIEAPALGTEFDTTSSFEQNHESVDITLVEKMINGIQETTTSSTDNSLVLQSENEEIEEFDNTDLDNLDVIEIDTQVDDLDLELEQYENSVTEAHSEIFEANLEEENDTDKTFVDADTYSLQESSEELVLEIDTDNDNELNEVEDISEIESVDFQEIQTEQVLLATEENVKPNVVDFAPPTYSKFSFTPKTINYDTEEILEELNLLSDKYPELQIFKVCELKYKQNLSIHEISKELDFSEDEIIEILNKIINTVEV